MLKLIKEQLQRIINDIDAGNSSLNEKDEKFLLECLIKIGEPRISKYEAREYINCSMATFDRLVTSKKLPKGKKHIGFKEKFWKKSDIDKYLNKNE